MKKKTSTREEGIKARFTFATGDCKKWKQKKEAKKVQMIKSLI